MADIKEWKLSLNLAGVKLFEPGAGMDRLPSGVYAATVKGSVQTPNKDSSKCDNVVIEFEVTEPSQKGKHVKIWLPVDPNVGEGMMGSKWKNLLAGMVKDPAALENTKGVNVTAAFLLGKPAFLHVQEVPGKDEKNRDKLPNINPIDKAMYEKFKAEGYGAATPAGATATGTQGSMEVKGGAGAAVPSVAAEVTLE